MTWHEEPALDALLDVVADDAAAALRRLEDRTVNRCRELALAAEEHVEGLARAAAALGRTRGRAVEASFHREAEREIEGVLATAFENLTDRFLARVETALRGLRDPPARYEKALTAWARSAAAVMDRPADAFAAPADRRAVYEALIAAGARDFQVHTDRDIDVGFVIRDLDGRTLLDRRPPAIASACREELAAFLQARVPEPPSLPSEGT